MRVILDLFVLCLVLAIVGCAFYDGVQPPTQPVMSPPCVDMSGATLMWDSRVQRLPPVQEPLYRPVY
jgi:hypothetical protein